MKMRVSTLSLGATPKQVDRELRAFSRAAKLLSSDRPRLIDEHPNEWVGVYHGKMRAAGESLPALIACLKDKGVPPNETIIRYIDASRRTRIL
jgi:hypothetical protein